MVEFFNLYQVLIYKSLKLQFLNNYNIYLIFKVFSIFAQLNSDIVSKNILFLASINKEYFVNFTYCFLLDFYSKIFNNYINLNFLKQ